MKRSPLYVLALAVAIGPLAAMVACGEDKPEPQTANNVTSNSVTAMPTPMPTPTPTVSETATTPPPPPAPPVAVDDMQASPDPKPMPAIKILAPGNELSVGDAAKAKDYAIRLDIKNWELGKDGQHVHLILDGNEYKKITDAKAPLKLGELPGGDALAEGQHYLIAFPSRGTHESVKGKGAASFVTFWVGKKAKDKTVYDGKKKVLIYSRPKGMNAGDMGKNLLLDFYLHGTTLSDGDGDKVRYTITGTGIDKPVTGEFTTWTPKIVHNLQKGEFDVKLELLDKAGAVSDLAWNTTTRHVKVDPDAPNDPNMGMAPGMPMPMGSSSAAPSTSGSAKSK